MDEPDNKNEANRRIRKTLKDLPRMDAAPDFESRLQRRLREERPGREGLPARTGWLPFRIPALGYSIVAVVIVGLFSTYILLQTKFREAPQEGPALNRAADSAASGGPAMTPSEKRTEEPAVSKSPAPSRQDAGTVKAPGKPLPEPVQQAAPAAAGEMMKDETKPAGERMLVSPPSKGEGEAVKTPPLPAAAVPAAPKEAFRTNAASYESKLQRRVNAAVPGRIDSAAIKDSLRADSLRRAAKRIAKPPGE